MRVISQKTIENWKNHLIEDEKSLATTEKYIRDINAFSNWLGGKTADKKIVLEFNPFNDLQVEKWYYTAVLEATITHNYYLDKAGFENKWEDCK